MSGETCKPSAGTFTTDPLFDALSHPRRRALLTVLDNRNRPQAVADLVKALVVKERATPLEAVPSTAIERVHLSLHHVHVPKLEDAGLIRYDRDRDTIALTERAARLRPHLERVAEEGDAVDP